MLARPALIALALAVACAFAAPTAGARDVSAYRGLGTWISIYSYQALANPDASAAAMKANGVRTLYLETANWRQAVDIVRPRAIAAMVEAAHAQGIAVVAWYLPSYRRLAVDERRAEAAIDFTTPSGQRFDGFALDIEADVVRSIPARNRQAGRLAAALRSHVGADYALGAIVPEAGALYWPGFPYAQTARYFDVFLPMAYFTFRVAGPGAVRGYITRNVRTIRAFAGPGTLVHTIGGLSDRASPAEIGAFVRAARAGGAIGASLYEFQSTSPAAWSVLAGVPTPAPAAGGAPIG
jgi:hypothetical protein